MGDSEYLDFQAWYFGFARQLPLHLELLQAKVVESAFPPGPLTSQWWEQQKAWQKYIFEVDFTVSRSAAFMYSLDTSDIWVYAGLSHLTDSRFGGSDRPLPLGAFLASLPHVQQAKLSQPSTSSRSSKAKSSSYYDDLPWADQIVQKQKLLKAPASRGEDADSDSSSATSSDEPLAFIEDEAALWAKVEALKSPVEDPKLRHEDFQVKVLGGKWTMEHKGVGADAIQGLARSREALQFCLKFKVPKSSRYEIATYGEEAAALFARTWVAKMQAFFNLWHSASEAIEAFSQEQYTSWVEPSDFSRQAKALKNNPSARKRVEQLRCLFRTSA